MLEGPTAIAFVKGDDPVAPAKAIVDFIKDHKSMSIKGAFVEGQVLDTDEVTALSKIPPKDILISRMIGSIQSPISGLVGTLQGTISGLVYTCLLYTSINYKHGSINERKPHYFCISQS